MGSEVIAVYDSSGREVGAEDRAVVYRDGLWHASAGVLVRSGDGRSIYVHRRTDTKMVFAGMHDCIAGGVLAPAETPRQTAVRELAEELGIIPDTDPTPLTRTSWDGEWAGRPMRCHMYVYELRYDGPVHHQPEEIADGWWWPEQTLREHLADPAWPFVPDSRVLLQGILT
ncbi:NUDIX hydrolase [Nocardia cyriacigeorgica]|uniref:NUDIX hydrolase n=1 Tax=Nocardia cyriacigeorgica TaxID=135487 RepID=UPI0028123081|nr:NUDIX domain-containing protein [Nocardia cyriacigeorgica]